jgi:MFS family permease
VLAVSATNSGQFLTPMMFGLLIFSTLAGQVMTRIRYYRFISTAGIALLIVGMLLLAQVGVHTSAWEVVRDIVIVGAGLGMTFPVTFAAVQSALPREVIGVATSQVQFWRNLGGTVGTAVLGSILARQLPGAIQDQIRALHLPAQFNLPSGQGSSPQSLFDPARLAQLKASLPPQLAPVFDQVITATRIGLADTLHVLFLYAAAIMLVALVASIFLREVPISRGAGPAVGEAPVPEAAPEPEREREPVKA